MKLSAQILGDKALTEQFKALSELAKSKVIRQATNYAMTPVLKEARVRTPVSKKFHATSYTPEGVRASGTLQGKGKIVAPGFLKRSMTKKTSQSKNRYVTRTKVGAAGKEAWYGLLLERGFKSYAPNPFLQKSFAARSSEVENRYKQKMRQAIEREARKRKALVRGRIARGMWDA